MANTFLEIRTEADLLSLVEKGIEESQTLDYKASPSLARDSQRISELCKDVTALANAAGGQLIYGIEEVNGKPLSASTMAWKIPRSPGSGLFRRLTRGFSLE